MLNERDEESVVESAAVADANFQGLGKQCFSTLDMDRTGAELL